MIATNSETSYIPRLRDREGAALIILRQQSAVAGAAGQILGHPGDRAERELVGIRQEGRDRAIIDRDRDVDIDVRVIEEGGRLRDSRSDSESRAAPAPRP